MECANPDSSGDAALDVRRPIERRELKRRRRFALPAHSKLCNANQRK